MLYSYNSPTFLIPLFKTLVYSFLFRTLEKIALLGNIFNMKKLFIFLLLILLQSPVLAEDFILPIDFDQEIHGIQDIQDIEEAQEIQEIQEELYINTNAKPQYNLSQKRKITPLLLDNKPDDAASLTVKKGDFSVVSTSKKGQNDYMKDNLRQRTEAKLEKKYFEVGAGLETKYESTNASKNSQSVFIAPKIKLTDRFSIMLNGKVNPIGSTAEQEVGINYKPKNLENSTFGVSGGTTFKNGAEQSQKMKLNTDFYLW